MQNQLAEVRARRDALHENVNEAIEHFLAEAEELDSAEEEYQAAERKAGGAEEGYDDARSAAVRHAAAAYQGADYGMVRAWAGADGLEDALHRGSLLGALADRRGATVDRAGAAKSATTTLRDHALDAKEEQELAEEAAAAAREEAQEAFADQEAAVESLLEEQGELERQLAASQDDPEQLEERRESAMERAEQAADDDGAENPAGTAEGGSSAEDPGTAQCTGGNASGFGNGEIPASALCPLPQPGQMLRADAAAGFIRLDGAYRDRFGQLMCVADSYRPLSEQVQLFKEMEPGMAAQPGTSAHGRGIAVDLCGGVNEHGSAQYEWMMDHAPDYGWHNPDWAQDGFEPWHWEFAP